MGNQLISSRSGTNKTILADFIVNPLIKEAPCCCNAINICQDLCSGPPFSHFTFITIGVILNFSSIQNYSGCPPPPGLPNFIPASVSFTTQATFANCSFGGPLGCFSTSAGVFYLVYTYSFLFSFFNGCQPSSSAGTCTIGVGLNESVAPFSLSNEYSLQLNWGIQYARGTVSPVNLSPHSPLEECFGGFDICDPAINVTGNSTGMGSTIFGALTWNFTYTYDITIV